MFVAGGAWLFRYRCPMHALQKTCFQPWRLACTTAAVSPE
ncbi:hypothetical protein [Polaromonas sp. CG9_12]|nr:hypothetical protein [Polaromonas sp. CG9_12]